MPPKPFPLAIGVGIDICSISRVRRLVVGGSFNRWTRRVFSRVEHIDLLRFARDRSSSIFQYLLGDISSRKILRRSEEHLDKRMENHWCEGDVEAMAQWCAGRWAAKEAAIKAHRQRHLYLRDVSVVTSSGAKPFALIAPQIPQVRMNAEVAASRGLYGVPKGLGLSSGTSDKEVVNGQYAKHGHGLGKMFFQRSKLYREDDQQIAELSISHDGDYAIAVCMAVDDAGNEECFPLVVDDGSGDPIHEPQWGDHGYLNEQECDELTEQ